MRMGLFTFADSLAIGAYIKFWRYEKIDLSLYVDVKRAGKQLCNDGRNHFQCTQKIPNELPHLSEVEWDGQIVRKGEKGGDSDLHFHSDVLFDSPPVRLSLCITTLFLLLILLSSLLSLQGEGREGRGV